MYQLCLDCYYGRPFTPWKPPAVIPTPKQYYKVEYSEAWTDFYMRPDRSYVYILQLDTEDFYVGLTTDLRKRLSEHRDKEMDSTAGLNPKLQYLEITATQKAAELRQAELKSLINSNPHQIHLMIDNFRKNMRKFESE